MQDIKPIYSWIVDSVIAKARPSFLQDGVDEAVLAELKSRWEQKLVDSNVFEAHTGEVDGDEVAGKDDTDKKSGKRAADAQPGDGEASKKVKASDGSATAAAKSAANTPETAAAAAVPADGEEQGSGSAEPAAQGVGDDDDAAENSDDELLETGAGEDGVQNMVLAQYDKVARNRNKWKCTMKHGIVHIDGREYVFSKASGEFVF